MKIVALVLGLLLTVCSYAQDEERVHVITADDCQQLLVSGAGYTKAGVDAAYNESWDEVWQFLDRGFQYYISATNACGGEDVNLANERMNENRDINRIITCTFHVTNSKDESVRSKLAFEQIGDKKQALLHAQATLYSLEEGMKWCTITEDVEKLTKARSMTLLAIGVIEDSIADEEAK